MVVYIYSNENKEFIDKNRVLDIWPLNLKYISFNKLGTVKLEDVSHLLVTGCLREIKEVMFIAYKNDITLGIIPTTKQKELTRTFELPSKVNEAIELALTPSKKKLDIFLCNEKIVLQEIVIGDAPPLDHFDTVLKDKTFFDRVKLFWMTLYKVKQLKHTKMKITDAKANEINISAVGVVGMEYNNSTFAAKLLASKLSANDGKIMLVILSPTSMLQYIVYLFRSLVSFITPKTLPNSVGYISSSKIIVDTKSPLTVRIDSSQVDKTPVTLSINSEALGLGVGEKFWEKQSINSSNKDSIKIDHLPSEKEASEYYGKTIPLFRHASQEQYTSLFSNLREEGKLNFVFITLLILSTMIATFGLFINSSSVVIGAMLLAPLMQPIVSLSMGVLRQDEALEINGAKSIFWGVLVVLFTAAVISAFTPIDSLTSEMSGRLSPTILDLFVAIVSGVAAAYVKSNEKILSSLAGVAIAVALVPPISVAGIGIGWGDWHMFMTAFLLFITNLVGIVLAASFTFMILGFSPFRVAKRGILIWLFIVSLVSIPLYNSFKQMKEDIKIQKILSNLSFDLGRHRVTLTHIKFMHKPKNNEIRCEVIASGILDIDEKRVLKEAILKSIHKEAEVIVTFRYRL